MSMLGTRVCASLLLASLVAGCAGGSGTVPVAASAVADSTPAESSAVADAGANAVSSTPYTCPKARTSAGTLDCTKLPLGDLKYSTAGPKKGYAYLCSAPPPGAPVVEHAPWLAATTWDLPKKVAVEGTVAWKGSFRDELSDDDEKRTVESDGVPVAPFTTGIFPIRSSDPAYAYDRNPNRIAEQTFDFTLAGTPSVAEKPACLPAGGPIGVTVTGVAIFNAFDAAGYDAVARELQDGCHGHPDQSSTYHYHGLIQACTGDAGSALRNSSLIGFAFDGFGIYGPWYDGKVLTSADLDACHGTTSTVLWNGKLRAIYHYVSTYEFPYTLGCYKGTPLRLSPPKP